ncbi:MAG: hypothetical protein CMM52_16250 [Rhodospirillaceae bacterium]|nr:hypothetical protein [Rhodospirillaceae bacterium]|tara:strand:+ start:13837 stop:14598 length:762 start_codon:yes stop_codon:yes gene_type:complete
MESAFLGVPDVNVWLFFGLTVFAAFTAFVGIATGAAGGLLMMVTLATIFPPVISIPLHTVVQMGGNTSRIFFMWKYVMWPVLLPFILGGIFGGILGANIFISLPIAVLQGLLGLFVLIFLWMPSMSQIGGRQSRFAIVGFFATFLGVFVSATGTLVAPFVAAEAADRRNHVATFSTLMAIVHVLKLIAFGFLGFALAAYLPLMLAMVASAIAASYVGSKALNYMKERSFRTIFKTICTLLALRLIWIALGIEI